MCKSRYSYGVSSLLSEFLYRKLNDKDTLVCFSHALRVRRYSVKYNFNSSFFVVWWNRRSGFGRQSVAGQSKYCKCW